MRNLKRVLSLALAAFMLVGMMVVGAGAVSLDEFSDAGEIDNKDAVNLLTTLGIIDGKEDGSYFDPDGNVTRAEMAKMISVILNKGADNNDLYVGASGTLTDVKGHWAEGHINFCSNMGIIAGRGDGTFDPGANVTASEAAKMLLVAVGYDPSIEGYVGNSWEVNVNAKAAALGIFNGYDKLVSAPLDRDDAALLIYNFLDVERIQQYSGNYALVYSDRRTVLGEMYGVYKVKGVVTGNKWAQLQETVYDVCLADGKIRLSELSIYTSNTLGTNTGSSTNATNNIAGIELAETTIFNVDTPVEYLGQSVNMYIRKTTVLNDHEVLGVYLRDEDNVVVRTAEVIDVDPEDNIFKTLLKGTGLAIDNSKDGTEYYVNYGFMADATAANDFMKLEGDHSKIEADASSNMLDNQYGIELTVIDNDKDGLVDYVLWMQEDLTRITDIDDDRDTINFQTSNYYPDSTLTGYNNGRPIDLDDVVFVDDAGEGDIVLVRTYGGRYYVSQPEVVNGKMEAYSADKTTEQYIEVGGVRYNASYINCSVDGEVEDLYAFDVAQCARKNDERAVQWDITYNFYLDSNGHIVAFQPSERLVPNYALILESGYDPGVYASEASGKITVVLSDNTSGTYSLNFATSAANLRNQINAKSNGINHGTSVNAGITELKGFLGTDYTDTSSTRPWNSDYATGYVFAGEGATPGTPAEGLTPAVPGVDGDPTVNYPAGKAAGYVITYTMDENNILTIQSVVGTATTTDDRSFDNATSNGKPGFDLGAFYVKDVETKYSKGDGRLDHQGTNPNGMGEIAVDLNTVAFYFWIDEDGENTGCAVIGYSKMENIDAITSNAVITDGNTDNFVATNVGARYDSGAFLSSPSGTNLAEMILFAHTGPTNTKEQYAYILGRNNHYDSGNYVDLYGVGTDGKAITLKVRRDEWSTNFSADTDYKQVWQYSTDADGVSTLTRVQDNVLAGHKVVLGSALRLTDGTIAFTDENTVGGNYWNIDSYLTRSNYQISLALKIDDGNVWDVRNLAVGADANAGSISTNSPKHAIVILDKANGNTASAAFIWEYTADEKAEPSSVTIATVDSTTITEGDSVTFTATAHNLTNAHYTWLVDGSSVGAADSATFTYVGESAGSPHTISLAWTDQYHSTPTASSNTVSVTVNEKTPGTGLMLTGLGAYKTSGAALPSTEMFGVTAVELPDSGKIVLRDSAGTQSWTVGKYYAYNGKAYVVKTGGMIEIDVDALEGLTSLNISDFTQVYKMNVADGVTPSSDSGKVIQDEDLDWYYFAQASDVVVTVDPAYGTGAFLTTTQATTKVAVADGKADGGTLAQLPSNGDVWVYAAAQIAAQTDSNVTDFNTADTFASASAITPGAANAADWVKVGSTVYVKAAADNNPGSTVFTITLITTSTGDDSANGTGSFSMPAAGVAAGDITATDPTP